MPLLGPFYSEAEALEECNSSSSGSEDGGDDTDNIVCGCANVADTLTMTVTGTCSWANGTYTLTRHVSGAYLYSNPTANPGVVSAGIGRLCGWHVQIRCPADVGYTYAFGFLSVVSCEPFSVSSSGTGVSKGGSCCNETAINITITE